MQVKKERCSTGKWFVIAGDGGCIREKWFDLWQESTLAASPFYKGQGFSKAGDFVVCESWLRLAIIA